jgi:glycosyltransferase involved in cell wall biosynthesis
VSALAWCALALPPALPLSITLWNLAAWPRAGGSAPVRHSVSVLVPARDEEASIEACVRAAAACGEAVREIIVYDDQSRDGSPAILRRLQAELPLLRVLQGGALPAGWVGKPHACEQLARAARGELLLFVDADTRLAPGAIGRLLALMEPPARPRADVLSAVPRQIMGSFAERLVLPLLLLTYTSWLPLNLVSSSRDPRCVAANGQLLAVRRAAYARCGGFAAVAHEIVDDVAFCRRAKQSGARVVFADGSALASCRMYGSFRALWRGFSKNLYEGVGARWWSLLLVLALYLGVFVLPYLGLVAALSSGAWSFALWPALCGVGMNVALRGALAWRFAQPLEGLLLHPLSVLCLCAIALNSWRWSARGCLTWAGRSYTRRAQRVAAAP